MNKSTSLVVIDDDELVAEAFGVLCDRIPGVHVRGVATNGQDGLSLMELLRPDLALVDLFMPHLNGVDVVLQAQQRHFKTRCIVLTANSDVSWCSKALRA